MGRMAAAARHGIVVVLAITSVVAAATLLWGRFNPETIAAARTIEVLSVLGMLLLPVATILVMEIDRRRRRERAHAARHAPPAAESARSAAFPGPEPQKPARAVVRHDPAAREREPLSHRPRSAHSKPRAAATD